MNLGLFSCRLEYKEAKKRKKNQEKMGREMKELKGTCSKILEQQAKILENQADMKEGK